MSKQKGEFMKEQKNAQTESYEKVVGKKPQFRVMAWIGIIIIIGLIVATFITGITGSPYFMGCLVLTIVVPVLIYVILWIGRILYNHANKQS